jgi:DNA processing protein
MSKFQPELFDTNVIQTTPIDSQENMATFVSVMALNSIRGVGQKTIQAMYDLGAINSIWNLKRSELENLLSEVGKKKLNLAKIIADEKSKLLQQGEQKAEALIRDGINFIANRFESFPQELNTINQPPRWLFVLGSTNVLSATGIVAIIGTREASQEGKATAYHLAKEFVFKNVVVLSGLAEGIDKHAHRGAVDHYGRTVGVLGHGINATYASKDKILWKDIIARDGAIITEYLPDESPSRENFLKRNEIQAALSNLVIPIESPDLASGTGATIRRALSLKKPLLGVELDQRENSTTKRTIENLRGLKIPIFKLPSEREKFWQFVNSTMPNHIWDSNPRERQQRFVNALFGDLLVINDFAEELRRASFTDKDIDWLATQIKKRLG